MLDNGGFGPQELWLAVKCKPRSLSENSIQRSCPKKATVTIGSGSTISLRSTISVGLKSDENGPDWISPTGS